MLCSCRSLATLSPTVMWKVENKPNELGGLAKEFSRQNIEGDTRFLGAYSKINRKLKEKWLYKRSQDLLGLKIPSLSR